MINCKYLWLMQVELKKLDIYKSLIILFMHLIVIQIILDDKDNDIYVGEFVWSLMDGPKLLLSQTD